MSRRIFVDTSAFHALEDRSQINEHEVALSVSHDLKAERALLVTTDFVLDETYTLLRSDLGHRFAVLFGQVIQRGEIEMIQVNESIQKEAWAIFESYADKDFSFTDCTSFVVMRRSHIETAFTFDRHFQQFGFRTLPERLHKKGK